MADLKNVSILFPYKSDNGSRDIAFKWVKRFYEKYLPDVEICIGEGECQGNQFSRSIAINNAAKQAKRDIFAIVDNDIFYDPEIIPKAIKLLDEHPWVIPFEKKHFINRESTNSLLNLAPKWPISIELEKHTPDKMKKSGLVIVPRDKFEIVKGFDERFCGWGGEDTAFVYAMNTLCGKYVSLDAEIYHLWHSHGGQKAHGNPYFQENKKLIRRYRHATRNTGEMEKLINEEFK